MFSLYVGDEIDYTQQTRDWERCIQHPELVSLSVSHAKTWLGHDFASSSSAEGTSIFVTPRTVYCFDGVIDYRDQLIRSLGEPPGTAASDVELLAAAHCRWGESCLEFIYGDFAGAVWTAGQRKLWAFSDHCARIKLYWSRISTGCVVSTYLPAVLATTGCSRDLDGVALTSTAIAMAPRPGRTAYRAIRFVCSGQALHWQSGREPVMSSWYTLPKLQPVPGRLHADQKQAFVTAFRAAVRTRLPSQGAIAGTLSGGLDSTLVMGHAANLLGDDARSLYAYTAIPHPGLQVTPRAGWDASDWSYATTFAQHHANVELSAVHAGKLSLIEQFRHQHQLLASPVRNGANHQWMLAIAAAAQQRRAKTLLVGQRGNQGISRSRRSELVALAWRARDFQGLRQLAVAPTGDGLRVLAAGLRHQLRGAGHQSRERSSILTKHLSSIEFARHAPAQSALSQAASDIARNGWAFGHCHMLQRAMCFAADLRVTHGVAIRDPTTDRRMLEVLFRLPEVSNLWRGLDRGIARWAGHGVVPDEIRERRTRGEQTPEEAGLASLFRADYEAAWASIRSGPIGEIFDVAQLDHRFRTLMAGRARRGSAAFMHRVLDLGLFLRYVRETWGSVDIDWNDPSDCNEALEQPLRRR